MHAIKQCITGMNLIETTSEYVKDDETGELVMVKQKKVEKSLPPNTDLIKLIYQHITNENLDYNALSDEDLEREKLRLLNELKEKEIESRESKDKNQM